MSNAGPATASRGIPITVIGLATMLLGGVYAAFGGSAAFAGADWLTHPAKDPLINALALGGIVPGLLIMFGVPFMLLGFLGLLAGFGVLLHKPWGRVLTFIMAVVAILLGLLWVGGSDQEATDFAIGGAQILYGILVFVVLIQMRKEFFRPRA